MRHCLRPLLACALVLAAGAARADKVPLDDEQLRDVSGKGVAVLVALQLDTSVVTSFKVNGQNTYLVAQNFGGLLDLFAITLDPSTRANGSDYLAIGMPNFIGAKDFGVKAIGVQTDSNALVSNSLGSLMLNGTANMTGQLNVWGK